jgi:hypothetical protein
MSPEEKEAYIRRIVDAAPPITPEDADFVRALMPGLGRTARRPAPQRPARPVRSRTDAA